MFSLIPNSPYSKPEPVWVGESVFIIGGGSSLVGFDWTPLLTKNIIGVNDAYLLGKWVDVCIYGDYKWYEIHRDSLLDFSFNGGEVASMTCRSPYDPDLEDIDWLHRVQHGMPKDGRIGWNWSTGAAAIHLALMFGCSQIYLLGFDGKLGKDGNSNWHDNPLDSPQATPFARMQTGFDVVEKDLGYFPGQEVINLGPDSVLPNFPKKTLEEVL